MKDAIQKMEGERAPDARRAKAEPESYDAVLEYFAERKMPATEARKFFDHYTANGWVQGRGKPIKDWKAAARNWENRLGEFERHGPPRTSTEPADKLHEWKFGAKPVDKIHFWVEVTAAGGRRMVLGPPSWDWERRKTAFPFRDALFSECREQGRDWWVAMGLEVEI